MDASDNTMSYYVSRKKRRCGTLILGSHVFFSDIVIPTRPTLGHSRFSELPNCSIQYEIRAGFFLFHLAWEMRGFGGIFYGCISQDGFFQTVGDVQVCVT